MEPKKIEARLHVLLARKNATALVIRRGPSKQVGTFLWDRKTNKVSPGQWLKGRIYERRSDISPDGKYFIYFAMNGKWKSKSKGSWTAISKTPYLKAIAFFPKGDGWNGGGLWTGMQSYWLNAGFGHEVALDTDQVRRDTQYKFDPQYGNECLSVYYPRLIRDGWKHIERRKVKLEEPNPFVAYDPSFKKKYPGEGFELQDIFEKAYNPEWTLVKIAQTGIEHPTGKGTYWDEHILRNDQTAEEMVLPHWEWAEVGKKKLLWAEKGKLFSGMIGKKGLVENEIFDFNQVSFEPLEAPY